MFLRPDNNFYRSLILKLMAPMNAGYLRMRLPTGEELSFGDHTSEFKADIQVRDDRFFRRCTLHGDIGFGESYVDGDWETERIVPVIAWMILNVENHPLLMGSRPKPSRLHLLKLLNRVQHHWNTNTLKGSRRNISAHYDLGNDFFALFLDPGMTYSSAYFDDLTVSSADHLPSAQEAKYRRLCEKLLIQPSDHVLEIGGGWGGFAVYAARHTGCRVTMITLSKEQAAYARERFKREHLSDRIEIRLEDYREVRGHFDKIVSIEMIEAVGHQYLRAFFRQCHRLLKKEGLLGLQAILSPDHRYESFRKGVDWIQKHIFPGGFLPSFQAILEAIRRTGDLGLYHYEDITPHYAKTLFLWRNNFHRHFEKVKTLGFDDRFIRKWNYYFSYCEAAFKMRNISVAQMIFSRPNNRSL